MSPEPTRIYHVEVKDDNTAVALEHELQVYEVSPNDQVSVSKSFGQGSAFVVVTVQPGESFDTAKLMTPILGVKMFTPAEDAELTPDAPVAQEETPAHDNPMFEEKTLGDEPAVTSEPVQ